jgi:ribosomal protein L40E
MEVLFMRIEGAGGCFDDRVYEVDRDLCWKIVKLSVDETGFTLDEVDEARCIIKFHGKDKLMQVAVQPIDEDTVHVIMDATKARLQIYSWKKETEEVELFYDIFEKKLRELRNYVICRQCGEKVSVAAKFCPECGSKM